ncbi:MAG: DUF302 domain-containing protein [Pseudomonadota bacterium]
MRVLISGLWAFIFISSVAMAQPIESREGWQVFDTDIAFDDLVTRMEAAISAEKMGLVTQASASNGARSQGIEIPGNRVMGVYRNDFARRMLDASVAAGIEAPIRFYLAENEGGGTTLAWKTPSFVFAPYLAEGGDDLQVLAVELDAIFMAIAQKAMAE